MRSAASCVIVLLLLSGPAGAQTEPPTPPPEETPTVYLDCIRCDYDHVRRTIPWVSWVRDREDATVHALVTRLPTGAGGTRFAIHLLDRGNPSGSTREIPVLVDADATEAETRERLTHALALGLLGYVAGTPRASEIRVHWVPGETADAPTDEETDPWDHWVFSVGIDGFASGQESASSASLGLALGANRTTENWKVRVNGSFNYSEDRFDLSDDESFTSILRTGGLTGLVVRSLGDHWSAGLRGRFANSTFANLDRSLRAGPALEFSVFSYREAGERDLRLLYSLGVSHFDYRERTVFEVTRETLVDQSVEVTLDLVQPWGSARLSLDGSVYLEDFEENRVTLSTGIDWRVFRGFSIVLVGDVSRIADQRNIPAGGIDDRDVLLRRRELLTSFSFGLSLGFSYRFGSRFANVVNPRF